MDVEERKEKNILPYKTTLTRTGRNEEKITKKRRKNITINQ